MSDNSNATATSEKKRDTSIVGWLSRQKEVIVLIMFFTGGIVFLYVNFVTQAQIKSLTCSLGIQSKMLAESADLRERQRMSAMLSEQAFIMSTASAELSDYEKQLLAHLRKSMKEEADSADAVRTQFDKLTEEMGRC